MTDINSKTRIMKIFAGEETDRMACFSGMSMVTLDCLKPFGYKFYEIHQDSRKMADVAAEASRLYGAECAVVPFDICIESQAMGCETNFYEDAEPGEILFPTIRPVIGHLVKSAEDLAKVVLPADFPARGRFPLVREAIGLLQKEVGQEIPVGAWLLGPLTWLGEMMDLRLLLKLVKKNEDDLVKVVDHLADGVIAVAKSYREAGVDYLCIREMTGSTNMISPKSFRKICKPALQKIFKALDFPTVLHICGNANHIIGDMQECGAAALAVEMKNDIEANREVIGTRPLLFGNIDVAALMTSTPKELVYDVTKSIMESGVDSVWPSCDVWPGALTENMQAMTRAVRELGGKTWLRKNNQEWLKK